MGLWQTPRVKSLPSLVSAFGLLLLTGVGGGACSEAELKVAIREDATDRDEEEEINLDASTEASTSGEAAVPGAGVPSTQLVSVLVQPGARYTAILAAINGAKKSVHVTIYILAAKAVLDALIAKKKEGVDVRVVLNQRFPDVNSTNQPEFDLLKSAGVGVVWATSALTFTHSKSIVIDGSEAWMMTMNLTESSPFQNREYIARVTDPQDVAQAEALFENDYSGKAGNLAGKLLIAPINAKPLLRQLVREATTTLDVQGESFGDDDLTKELVDAKGRGVNVRLSVSDTPPTPAEVRAFAEFKKVQIPVRTLAKPYVHAKAIVIDGKKAYVGSANFTTNSLQFNREIGVIVGNAGEVKKIADTISQDFNAGTAL